MLLLDMHGLICDKIWHASWETQKVGPKTPENIFKSLFLKMHPVFGPGIIMFTNMFGKWTKTELSYESKTWRTEQNLSEHLLQEIFYLIYATKLK